MKNTQSLLLILVLFLTFKGINSLVGAISFSGSVHQMVVLMLMCAPDCLNVEAAKKDQASAQNAQKDWKGPFVLEVSTVDSRTLLTCFIELF